MLAKTNAATHAHMHTRSRHIIRNNTSIIMNTSTSIVCALVCDMRTHIIMVHMMIFFSLFGLMCTRGTCKCYNNDDGRRQCFCSIFYTVSVSYVWLITGMAKRAAIFNSFFCFYFLRYSSHICMHYVCVCVFHIRVGGKWKFSMQKAKFRIR